MSKSLLLRRSPLRRVLGQTSHRMNVNIHRFPDSQNKRTRILQTPLYIWDSEVHLRRRAAAANLQGNNDGHHMRLPVERHRSLQLHLRTAVVAHGAHHMLRSEDDRRKFLGLENLLLHLLIARVVAGLSAGGIHHQFAIRRSRRTVKAKHATLQLKSSVDRVQNVAERPINGALCRIELKNLLLGERRRAHQQRYEKAGCFDSSRNRSPDQAVNICQPN